MPIAAIPQGVEIRKISSVKKRALDELLKHQKEQTLLQTAMVALIPSATALTIAAGAGYLFIHRDTIADQYQQLKEDLFGAVGQGFADFGKTITGGAIAADEPSNQPEEGTVFQNLTKCQLFEYDITELFGRMENASFLDKFAIGFNLQQKYRGMKKEGCPKPARVRQEDWDRA
jgi:hypothetical protein